MMDKYIFSGNRMESVPRALFLDQRLTPLERNAWFIIRMMLDADNINDPPTYEKLQPYLTSMPLAEKASTETVARALIILRLTRWLNLVVRKRNKNGSILGNVYVLHDEPLSLYECLQVEPDYLILLCNATSHSSKAIQRVAMHTLNELVNDPHLKSKKLPTRLEILTERFQRIRDENLSTAHKSEVPQNEIFEGEEIHESESEVRLKASNINTFRNRKSLSSSNKNNKILLQELQSNLKLPKNFAQLTAIQQQSSLLALSALDLTQQQQVLDEWQQRCDSMTIQKPAAYLNGIIQKAIKGELNLLKTVETEPIKNNKPVRKDDSKDIEPPSKPVDHHQAKQYITVIKNMLKGISHNID